MLWVPGSAAVLGSDEPSVQPNDVSPVTCSLPFKAEPLVISTSTYARARRGAEIGLNPVHPGTS